MGKRMQPSERYYELAFVFRRDARLQGRILVDHFRSQSQKATLTKEKLGGWERMYSIITTMFVVYWLKRYAPMCD